MKTKMKKKFTTGGFAVLSILIVLLAASPLLAAETSVLKGKVNDVEDRAVSGARIFVYDSPEVRRSADFISSPTDQNGMYRIVLKPGKYWAIARLKKAEGYGPLMTGDKHSGDPAEIEVAEGRETVSDFVVADLKEARKLKSKDREGPIKISGRILDEKGSPVTKGYAFANRVETVTLMPDYISAWGDSEGHYTLYLPPGKYYIGGSEIFPPDPQYVMKGPILLQHDRSDLDISISLEKR